MSHLVYIETVQMTCFEDSLFVRLKLYVANMSSLILIALKISFCFYKRIFVSQLWMIIWLFSIIKNHDHTIVIQVVHVYYRRKCHKFNR